MSTPEWIGCPVHLQSYYRLGWAATVSEPDGTFKARWSAPTLDEVCSSLVANGVFDAAQMADVRERVLARPSFVDVGTPIASPVANERVLSRPRRES